MNRILVIFIGAILNTWILIYACSKMLNKKTNYRQKEYWILLILMSIYLCTTYILTNNFIKVVLSLFLVDIICKKIYNVSLINSTIASFMALIINLISEIIYVIILVLFFKIDNIAMKEIYFGSLITSLSIFVIMYIILNIKFVNCLINKIISNFDSHSNKVIIIFSFLTMFTVTMVIYYIYFEMNLLFGFILCFILICMYSLLTINLFLEKSEYIRLQTEYEITLNNLNEYEKMYEYQRLLNHEYKNNLLVIRGLTSKNNRILLDFIDEILNIKEKESKKWMTNLKRIPEGGLRGLLYFKLILMEEKNCNIEFFIGKKFKTKDYKNLSNSLKQNICKILGIYLDNSMQALEKVKNRNIAIRIDGNDNKVIIVIINNFEENIDLDKIYNRGYSTKEKGRGYGLAIVKEILERESKIINKTSIIGSNFCQELQIKM